MKKIYLLFATLVLSFTAQAAIINGTPNPGDFGRLRYWVHTVANAGDTIVLADGTYEEKSVIDFTKAGLVVMAAEGANPVIQTVGLWMEMNVEAATTFEGIVFDAEAGTDGDNQYGFNINANTTFNNCKFQDYTKYAVKLLAGTTTLDNCVFDGAGVTPSAIVIDGTIAECSIENSEFKNYKDYNISVEDNTTIATLAIDQCVFDGAVESVNTTKAALFTKGIVTSCTIEDSEFKNFAECAITVEKWYGGRFDALTINDCLIHDCTQSAIYLPDAIDTNEKQTCSDFKLTNSTIYNIGNDGSFGTIDIQDNTNIASEQQVLVDHVTIYNFLNSGWHGAIKVEESANAVVSNCIVMNTVQEWANPYKLFTGAQIKNSLYYNTEYADNGATTTNLVEADPMFVDAANGDFQLYGNSPAVGAGTDGSNLGDPRWGVKAGLKPGAKVLSKAVAAAEDGATITLGDGIYEESSSFDFDKEGLTIVAAEGTNPVIKTTDQWTSLGIVASTTFDGITFDGGNLTKTSLDTKGTAAQTLTLRNCEFKNYTDYNINVVENTTINTITIDNCVFDGVKATKAAILAKGIVTTCTIEDSEFKKYAEYCITANDYYRGRIDGLSINNCLLHDGAVAIYMPKYADAGDIQTCADFSLTNSTIYNMVCTTAVIDIRSNPSDAVEDLNKVAIDHITIYNYDATNGAIYIAKTNDMSISNSIIATPEDKGQRALYVYGGTVDNTIHFNGSKRTGNTVYTKCENVDPMFVGATDANFDIYANSPAVGAGTDGSNLGDPRWGVSAKVLGKRINVTPDQASSLPWMIQSDESNVKAGDTIVLAAGTYELSSFELRKEGLVIMAAENAEVKIATMEGEYLKLVATTTFDGITFDGSNVANYAIRSIGTSAKNLIVRNCEFTQYARYNIYGDDGTHLDSLIVDNCIFNNSGAAIYFPASALADNVPGCSYAKVTNSTLYNIILNDYVASIDIQENNNAKQTGNTEVVIDHVTIYNFSSTAKSAIKVYKSGKTNITNSIVANPNAPAEGETIYSYYIFDGAKVQNSLSFNAKGQWASNAYTDTIHADPLFVDAANANFMLSANSPAVGAGTDDSNLGDPRWGVAEPAFITLTTGDNSAVIAANINKTVDVVIERSFTANDGYYTLCVPFNMPASVIGKAYSLGTITEHVGGEGINIELKEERELSAGMPYLVLPKEDMDKLVVENVTIAEDDIAGQNITNDELNVQIFFQGYYSASGQTDGELQYYVGNNGYLYHDVVDIRGLCGLFTITDKEGNPTRVRARVVAGENGVTGVEDIITNDAPQKVIENGQLIIIRNGVKYNVQGQVIK